MIDENELIKHCYGNGMLRWTAIKYCNERKIAMSIFERDTFWTEKDRILLIQHLSCKLYAVIVIERYDALKAYQYCRADSEKPNSEDLVDDFFDYITENCECRYYTSRDEFFEFIKHKFFFETPDAEDCTAETMDMIMKFFLMNNCGDTKMERITLILTNEEVKAVERYIGETGLSKRELCGAVKHILNQTINY